ncbi:MAG TPA: YbdK family carboxylate-amine ligase [Gammaproteobacteria bacterium]|jgi:carboxylate-amine ligase|nr:YbdK family carboxylate-amine ligase [Gammaproteobacteria bacterium]
MKILPYKKSLVASMGIELEFQIINPKDFALISRAKDLIRNIKNSAYEKRISPEITQSMIEINSSIHTSPKEMLAELSVLHEFLLQQAQALDINFCGGGTHPFQKWTTQKIFPTVRYKNLSRKYRYLSKRSTVFGQHIHVGCENGEDAIYLTHALARYVPQLIAISASSPFYQGIDTGYFSSRSTVFSAFPLYGVMPFLTNWEDFSDYFYKMRSYGIINTMKDFYWDIRPKPEFGTVEIRVCDTPLTIKKAVIVAAYVQALSLYLLEERPVHISRDLYYLYNCNRFQASRYGYDGEFINVYTASSSLIVDDIIETIKKIERYANHLNSMGYIAQLMEEVMNKKNDAVLLRQLLKQSNSFSAVVSEQCKIWATHT